MVFDSLPFPLVYAAYVGVAEGARVRALEIARRKPASHAMTVLAGRMENAFMAAEISLDRMIRILREGRAQSKEEALDVLKADLRALTADVQVEQEEHDEVVVIKPLFLVSDYQ